MPRHPGPERGVGTVRGSVHVLERPALRAAHLDAVHDRVAKELWKKTGRAFVRRSHSWWLDPRAADIEFVFAERGVDGQDLLAVHTAHGTALGDVAADRRQDDFPFQFRAGDGIGQVLRRRPDRGSSGSGLERDERSAKTATAEQEVARCRQLRSDLHAPVQFVILGFHAQEGSCIHGAAR